MTANQRLVLIVGAIGCLVSSCSSKQEVQMRDAQAGDLPRGAVARVGDEVVSIDQVVSLAEERSTSVDQARTALVYDALMAEAATHRGYDRRDEVVVQRRGLLSRALLEQLRSEAVAEPITDEEVQTFTEQHWLDLDRPVARKTVHAIVMPDDPEDPAQMAKAETVAQRIAEAVASVQDAKAFHKNAEAVDDEGLKVLVQDLEPVTRDGRVADLENRPPPGVPPRYYAKAFAAAVFDIPSVGDSSGPFRSPFGWHVALLVSIQPEKRVGFQRRREVLAEEIRTQRAKKRMDELVASLREKSSIEVVRNANTMLQLVPQDATERGE